MVLFANAYYAKKKEKMLNAYHKLIEMFIDRAESMNIKTGICPHDEQTDYTKITHVLGPKGDIFIDIDIHFDLSIDMKTEIGKGPNYVTQSYEEDVTVARSFNHIRVTYELNGIKRSPND